MGKAQRLQEWWFPIATNLEKAMRDDMEGKKPAEIPGAVGSVGAQLVEQLYEIRGVRAGLSAKGQ